jgi:polyphosphate kinase
MNYDSPLNRELSWLNFNRRVLQEAADRSNPLVERMKFLGIFSNNQDEFFRVRVAALNRMIELDNQPMQVKAGLIATHEAIRNRVNEMQELLSSYYREISAELDKEGIHIIDENHLLPEHTDFVRHYFRVHVRPHMFPVILSRTSSMDYLRDKSIFLLVDLRKTEGSSQKDYALVKIPTTVVSRFLILPEVHGHKYIILLDDVIRYCLAEVFEVFGYQYFKAYTMKFTRDAELDLDNDISKSFMEIMTESLKQRSIGRPVRFVYDKTMPAEMLKMMMRKLNLSKYDTLVASGRYHNFKDFMGFPNMGRTDLEAPLLPPLPHPDLPAHQSILKAMRSKDVLLFFPYHSYSPIVDLLREASLDTKVRSIKITLYRLARNSNVINALISAARNGKSVTVFMELQARFDEMANIQYASRLQEEGVRIIEAIPGFKVHSKLLLIKRKENKGYRHYGYVGTGNFNEQTAKVYSDCAVLTCNPSICEEMEKVFSLFEANYLPQRFRTLVVSPFNQRIFILRMLNEEMRNARQGKEAWCIIKLNNLVDDHLIKRLYQAARTGVKIKLIIRGVCSVDPDTEGVNGNIEAISIVDRFLEHARILIFCHGGEELTYLTSADWMVRNLDNRIEVTCPVLDPTLKRTLRDIIDIQLRDNVKARILDSKDQSEYKHNQEKQVRSQIEIYSYFKQLSKPT